MSEIARESNTEQGQPPAGGRQDHDAMRAASMLPLSGPANPEDLAASGGLSVPGHDPHPVPHVATINPTHEPIPGEYDRTTLTHREPGAMGMAADVGVPTPATSTMTEETQHDHQMEGGLDPS